MQKMKWRGTNYEAIVRCLHNNYKKRDIYVCQAKSVTLHDLNWGGGSRNEYWQVELIGTQYVATKIGDNHTAPWNNKDEGKRIELNGKIIVQGGTFCGKEATLFVYVEGEPR